jgi:diguanylate cyclase (GGDEF)-like protein
MFKLLRYFSITSLIVIVVMALLLSAFYERMAQKDLVRIEQARSVALTQSILNSVGPQFFRLLNAVSEPIPGKTSIQKEWELFNVAVLAQIDRLPVARFRVFDMEGLTIFSTDSRQIGASVDSEKGYHQAWAGIANSALWLQDQNHLGENDLAHLDILSSYVPIREVSAESPIRSVLALDIDVTTSMNAIKQAKRKMVMGVVVGLAILYIILFFIIRRADRIINRQALEREQSEKTLRHITQGVSASTGETFFRLLAKHLSRALNVDSVIVSELDQVSKSCLHTIVVFTQDRILDNFSYDLSGTPCEMVLKYGITGFDRDVSQQFLKWKLMKDLRAESYMGIPLLDAAGKPLGLLTILDEKPIENTKLAESMLKIFAARAAGEIERRQTEVALAEQALRDSLTGLYNRRQFYRQIESDIAKADHSQNILAILLCALDGFKTLNDAQGHQAGDRALGIVAQRIRESVAGSDQVFRWGEDEFVVILSRTDRERVIITADRIRKVVRETLNRIREDLDVSIGIAVYPDHARRVDDLIRIAGRAVYIAKKGGSRTHFGEEEYSLREDTIKVVFQPVVDVQSNEFFGYEALSRDAQGKMTVSELFRKFHRIGKLDELKVLCFRTQMKTAQEVGLKKVFLNIDFNLLRQLQPMAIPEGMQVVLEVSESEAIYDLENHLDIAKLWQDSGYKFAIDDFGAGFVSLPFIARLVPEHIKLDRSTLLQAVESSKFKPILRDLLLGLRNCSTEGIIAEGVESAKELEVVKELKIPLVQGFLLGKPEEIRPPSQTQGPSAKGSRSDGRM